jgi:hypothetical protein
MRKDPGREGEDTVWCVFLDDFHDTYDGGDLAARVIEKC